MNFSVVVPYFNSSKTLRETLKSLEQQNENFEVILIDDGSTDNSFKIAQEFKKKIKNIFYLKNKKNLGVSISRNKGIKNSKGKYIIFLDSDDTLNKFILSDIWKFIKRNNLPDVIFARYEKEVFPKNNLDILKSCFNRNKNYFVNYILKKKIPLDECWPYIIKNDFIKKNRIYFDTLRVAEDQIFVLKIFLKMKNIFFYKKRVFYFHRNFSNTLSDFMDYSSGLDCLRVLISFLKIKKDIKNINLINLCEFYIQNILSMFSGVLIQSNKKQIKYYYKFAKSKKILFKDLVSRREKFPFKNFLNRNFILIYRDTIISTKLNLVRKIKGISNLYLFCYSKFTSATIEILKQKREQITYIVDDNKNLLGKYFQKIKIINTKKLIKDIKEKDFCIISNHRDITLKNINKGLISKGLKQKQLVFFKY